MTSAPRPSPPDARHAERAHRSRAAVVVAAGVVVTLVAGGCASKVIATHIDEATLCRSVEGDALGRPVEPGSVFGARDGQATLRVVLVDLDGAHTVRYRWIDPTGAVHLDSGPVPLNEEGSYRPRASVAGSMPIAGAPAALLPGRWRVVVEYDGEAIYEDRFVLERR